MRRDRELYNLERKYIGKRIRYYLMDVTLKDKDKQRHGPYTGVVEGLTTCEAEAERLGDKTFSSTGELIVTPDGGIKGMHEEFPWIDDVEILPPVSKRQPLTRLS